MSRTGKAFLLRVWFHIMDSQAQRGLTCQDPDYLAALSLINSLL